MSSQPNYNPAHSPASMRNMLMACQSDTAYLADLLTSCSKPTRAAKTLQTLNEKLSWLLNLDREREQAKKVP